MFVFICLIWEKSSVALSRTFAALNIFLSPSGVSHTSYNSFIASALVVATAFFAALFASLYVSLSSCLRDVYNIFSATFLAVINSCTLSFHHHVSLSPGGLRPVVIPNTSCPTLNIVELAPSDHYCTLSTGRTLSNTFLNCTLRLFPLISTTLSLVLPFLVFSSYPVEFPSP